MLQQEFEEKILSEIIRILGHYHSYKKYNLSRGNSKTKDMLKDEVKDIAPAEYVPCLKAIYKKLSSIIYSHHCMARFHHDYDESKGAAHLRPITNRENKEMLTYFKNRTKIWDFMQN